MFVRRRKSGTTIAEAGAALGLLLPLAILIIFVVLEASYAYLIKTNLTQAARRASRDLAIAYGQDSSIASSRSLQDAQVFSKITINKFVHNTAQFDNPIFDTASDPPTVSSTVRYASGSYGLPTFPNPDPLHLGNTFSITATSTYRLE